MDIPLGSLLNGFDVFLLVFVRMTGLFVIAPIFGRKNIPSYLKIGFSFFLAIILVNTITFKSLGSFDNIFEYMLIVLKEFLVGITIGYISYLVFSSVYVAGQLIDMEIGFGMVNVLDPVSNIQVPITSNFYFIISMLVFMSFNGHHMLIKALFDSYNLIPLGGAVFNKALLGHLIVIFADIFIIGFKIAAPIIVAILLTDITLGIISRTIPQLNVFVVGMPLKIIIGIIVIIATIPAFLSLTEILVGKMNGDMFVFIKDMAPK